MNLLAVLEQNPDTNWKELIGFTDIKSDQGAELELAVEPDDEFTSFQL